MPFHPNEKLAIFIDGSNLFSTVKALNIIIDYGNLRRYFADRSRLLRVNYYTAIVDDAENSPLKPLVNWLDYNGYTMITKPAKEFIDGNGVRRIKGNMDIELAVDMIDMAKYVDHMVLFSGDGDFRSLVEALQRKGVKVSVISSTKTRPSMIADELRRQADSFIEISDLTEYFTSNGASVEIKGS